MNVAPLSAKDIVRSDGDAQVQVAGLPAVGARLSLAGHAYSRPILDPGGDSDFDRIGTQRGALPLAGWTRPSTKNSAPVADGARHWLLQRDTLGHTGAHLGERQVYFGFKILAWYGKSTAVAGSPSSFEQILEDIGKTF